MISGLYLEQRSLYCPGTTISLTQSISLRGVVVHTEDVADKVIPTIITYCWSCRIKGLSQVKESLYVVTLCRIPCYIWHTPTLIERYPRYNAGMIVVAFDYLHPFPCQPLNGQGGKNIGVGHLSPDQETTTITQIEKAWVRHSLMNTQAIEPHGFSQFNLALQCFHTW